MADDNLGSPPGADLKENDRVSRGKKKWERPRIRSGQLFETNTVSCAKQPGNPGCGPGPFVN
jgi:hypothetical protein